MRTSLAKLYVNLDDNLSRDLLRTQTEQYLLHSTSMKVPISQLDHRIILKHPFRISSICHKNPDL